MRLLLYSRPRRFYRYSFFILLIVYIGISILILFVNDSEVSLGSNNETTLLVGKYSIRTNGCHIPEMEPMSDVVTIYFANPDIKPCPNSNYSLILQNNSHIWINKDRDILYYYSIYNRRYLKCCYFAFYRPNSISDIDSYFLDNRVVYEQCIAFNDSIEARHEFVRVSCTYRGYKTKIEDMFFVFVPFKSRNRIQFNPDGSKIEDHKNSKKFGYNVLIMGIDNLSRLNFHRTMPKTLAYMEKMGAIELMGYNKVGDNSFDNLVPFLMGHAADEIKEICHPVQMTTFDDCPFLWHWFRDAGYYTAFGEDVSWLGTFNYQMKGFRKTPTDYYLHPFMSEAEKTAGRNEDLNTFLCLNEHYVYQILLNYIKSITETLGDHKLFGFFWETSMTHDYFNYAIAIDDSYEQFLKNLQTSGYLNRTFVFLISDHGNRWGPFRKTTQGFLEERLPIALILAPPSFRQNYTKAYNNLKHNSRQLTTPYDMHETLLDLIHLDSIRNENLINENYANARGISLFLKIPDNRTCEMAEIPDHFCACHERVALATSNKMAKIVAEHLIYYLNLMLVEFPECTHLELDEVLNIEEVVSKKILKDNKDVIKQGSKYKDYTVVVKVKPSGGEFEGTLRKRDRYWSVVGTVSRLNRYDNESYCVHDPRLKLYCYCSELMT